MLFATVAVARKLGVDAESALRRTVRTFAERYERFTELARRARASTSRRRPRRSSARSSARRARLA